MSRIKEESQYTRVLGYMKKNKGITSWEAIKEFGVTRLSAVIFDLKKQGFIIGGEYVHKKNRYGEPVKYKRYFLLEEKPKHWYDRIRLFM